MQRLLTEFAIRHSKLVMWSGLLITFIFLAAFPSLKTDTDPIHMLPQDNPAISLYKQVKAEFDIYDLVVLGINSKDGSSLFTAEKLATIHKITQEILEIRDEPPSETTFSKFFRKLQFLKEDVDSNSLDLEIFVRDDVMAISQIDDMVRNEAGELLLEPLMATPPQTDEEAADILRRINDNPMINGKMTSEDGSLVGIFIPLKNGKKIAVITWVSE